MINKINFTGNVYASGRILEDSNPREISRIKRYSKEYDVDVFVYSKTNYMDEVGAYEAAVAKDGRIWLKTFDMKHPSRSYLKEVPGQIMPDRKIAGLLDSESNFKHTQEELVFKRIDVEV